MKVFSILAIAAASCLVAEAAVAGPEKFEAKGFITNAAGERCSYQQKVVSGARHFHGDAIASTNGEIVFDDPQCMKDAGEGLDANKTMINETISKWYSHADANFDTKNLRRSSLAQEVGQCMQSKRFAAIGVVLDYEISDGSIVKVYHGPALEGCLN
jgi:hypothetical protein